MYIRQYTGSLILFAYWDRRPKTHQGEASVRTGPARQAETPNSPPMAIRITQIKFWLLLPSGIKADN
jgi:hypothetical protein